MSNIREQLERAFVAGRPMTVGVEEELILLDPGTLEPAPVAAALLERLGDPERFKAELPAAQLEIVTPPLAGAGEAIDALAAGRAAVLANADGPAAAIPVHPFAALRTSLSTGPRYERIADRYGQIAELQLVGSLHVHVCAGDPRRSLAIYNELRSYLPEIMALAASGPFHAGADSGLATVRPKIADLLPRQGVPPAFASLDDYAKALEWLVRAEPGAGPGWWWYELRLHPQLGTVEVRVADAQARLAEAGALTALIHSIVAELAARFDAGELGDPAPTERIEQNRFSAIRDGVEGEMADMRSGEPTPTRQRLNGLLERARPYAKRLGCENELGAVAAMIEENGAIRQRRLAAEAGGDLRALTGRVAGEFAAGLPQAISG